MPKQTFIDKNFSIARDVQIGQAEEIIEEYQAQGYTLTLRQLYYQFVARDMISNTERSYKNLGSLISDARLAGRIDWAAIEDRTRNLVTVPHWEDPADIVRACAQQYRVDLWEGQPFRPEVWIEKEALIGVIERVCQELDISYFACRGYVSQSETWAAGRRAAAYKKTAQELIILHLGDHDPSGMDMTRDNRDRLSLFANIGVTVRRLALNMDQVEQYNPPPNPAKVTDSRAKSYIQEFGDSSWELDALEPQVIGDLIRHSVYEVRDDSLMAVQTERQARHREQLVEVADDLEDA